MKLGFCNSGSKKCCLEHLQMVYRIRKTKSTFLTFADAKISINKAGKTQNFSVSSTPLNV